MYSFDEYYDLVSDALVGMGETKKPDRATVFEDFENDLPPQESAQLLFDAWN